MECEQELNLEMRDYNNFKKLSMNGGNDDYRHTRSRITRVVLPILF